MREYIAGEGFSGASWSRGEGELLMRAQAGGEERGRGCRCDVCYRFPGVMSMGVMMILIAVVVWRC